MIGYGKGQGFCDARTWAAVVQPIDERGLAGLVGCRSGDSGRTLEPEPEPEPSSDEGRPLAGGNLLAAISTAIVGILADHYGRGPMRAKTYVLDDIIVVVMRGSGFTALEQTIMDSGQPERVIEMREDFQRVMKDRYSETIKELTGRNVVAFLSQAHVEPDLTLEIFFIDGPLPGFGALELIDPEANGAPPDNPEPD